MLNTKKQINYVAEEPKFENIFTYKHGVLHSYDDKPAVVKRNRQEWYKEGVRHRDGDLPALVTLYSNEWWVNGKRHRDGDKPAVIEGLVRGKGEGRRREWYKDGLLHREGDFPAIEEHDEEQGGVFMWYKNGKRHRDGGKPVIVDWMNEDDDGDSSASDDE